MKLGLQLGYWMNGPEDPIETVQLVERLGYDSIWTGEAYGSDCFTPLCWMGARTSRIKLGTSVMQLSARTPACAAMTAMTIDHLSGGRLILGVGVSGPQVVEGWYGQAFPRPLERTREWLALFRQMIAREAPVEFHGKQYDLPLQGGSGLGKPLKLITTPRRSHIPVYLGAEGPKNVRLAADECDGWLPLFVSPHRLHIFEESLRDRAPDFDIAATVQVMVNDKLDDALLGIKMMLGFYLGGMGAKGQNFHKNLIERMGFGEAAEEIQQLFLSGEKEKAIQAVPDALADEIALCGPWERIKERLELWKASPVTTLIVTTRDPVILERLAEELL